MNDEPTPPKVKIEGSVAQRAVDLDVQLPKPEPQPEPPSAFKWETALGVVGAAVALGLWIQVVGGAVLWGRFEEADLPASQIVGLVPNSVLVTVGLRSLALPFVVGIFAVAVLYVVGVIEHGRKGALRTANTANEVPLALWIAFAVLAVAAVATVFWRLDNWSDEFGIALLLAVVALGFLLAFGAATSGSYTPLAALVFAVAAAWGGAVGYLEERNETPHFDLAALLRKQETVRLESEEKPKAQDRTPVSGFLVGRSGDSVLLATIAESFTANKWRVVIIPQNQVEEMSVGPSCPVTPGSLAGAEALARELDRDQADKTTRASVTKSCERVAGSE